MNSKFKIPKRNSEREFRMGTQSRNPQTPPSLHLSFMVKYNEFRKEFKMINQLVDNELSEGKQEHEIMCEWRLFSKHVKN